MILSAYILQHEKQNKAQTGIEPHMIQHSGAAGENRLHTYPYAKEYQSEKRTVLAIM